MTDQDQSVTRDLAEESVRSIVIAPVVRESDRQIRAEMVERLHHRDCHHHPLSDHTPDVAEQYGQQVDAVLEVQAEARLDSADAVRRALDAAIAAALPLAGGRVRSALVRLRTALDRVDDKRAAAGSIDPHAHVCLSCSRDGISPRSGCLNCRQTGMDQTPCQAEGHVPTASSFLWFTHQRGAGVAAGGADCGAAGNGSLNIPGGCRCGPWAGLMGWVVRHGSSGWPPGGGVPWVTRGTLPIKSA